MNVRFTNRAENDVAKIIDFLIGHSPKSAQSVAASLFESIRVVSDHPLGGERTSKPDVFVKIVPRYPYKIFYRLRENAIEILHVRHASRRPWTGR